MHLHGRTHRVHRCAHERFQVVLFASIRSYYYPACLFSLVKNTSQELCSVWGGVGGEAVGARI